jgi:hypothetical protein
MLSRLVGALVVLLAFGGCAYLGIQEMVTEQQQGGVPLVALVFLIVPLLVVGWVVVRIGRHFIGRWQHDYLNRTLGERRIAGLGVAVLSAAVLYGGVAVVVPSHHPGHDLTAALKPSCSGGAVAGAGVMHWADGVANHLVVLGPEGNEQRWTGSTPIEWKPASVADTELVACVSDEDLVALVETCQYINGPAIRRYSATRHVRLVEPGTAAVVAEYDVGDRPRDCRQSEEHDVVELKGKVAWEMVETRLAEQAGCCTPWPATTPRSSPPRPVAPSAQPPMPTPPMPTEPAEPAVPVQPETPVP